MTSRQEGLVISGIMRPDKGYPCKPSVDSIKIYFMPFLSKFQTQRGAETREMRQHLPDDSPVTC